jgi:hypothetical protein
MATFASNLPPCAWLGDKVDSKLTSPQLRGGDEDRIKAHKTTVLLQKEYLLTSLVHAIDSRESVEQKLIRAPLGRQYTSSLRAITQFLGRKHRSRHRPSKNLNKNRTDLDFLHQDYR